MILPHILDIVAVCAAKGIQKAVISPGSRSAAMTIAFEHHPDIEVIMVPDERSAGFIAMGIAQKLMVPTVLVCTSGSALLNYAPSVVEAYYQEIPLLVLSADRPPEWIDQYDGQTIQQSNAFGKHAKGSFALPTNPSIKEELWQSNRIVNEAINLSTQSPKGPVHINVPIREPFYPSNDEKIEFDSPRTIERINAPRQLEEEQLSSLLDIWQKAERPLIIMGHADPDPELASALSQLVKESGITVINDIIGNQHGIKTAIQHQDAFLNPKNPDLSDLVPDLVITIGKSLISKNLKLFLRKHPPLHHWHVQESERLNDGLQHLSHQIVSSPVIFIKSLIGQKQNFSKSFQEAWLAQNQRTGTYINQHGESGNHEFAAYHTVMSQLPKDSELQLANSMAVRYANIIGLRHDQAIEVFSNRGTSGIDGSNGTAVGSTITTNKLVTLLTGDMAFLYDRNAFWHHQDLSNLRIIVFNNSGGGIFRMIPGPTNQKTYENIFETKHDLTAKATATEFGMEYQAIQNIEELKSTLAQFFTPSGKPKVIEYCSDASVNTEAFKAFKAHFSA